MDKCFSQLPLTPVMGAVSRVHGMALHELFVRGSRYILQCEAIEQMEINSRSESGFKFIIVGFPYYDLEISAIEVGVANSKSWIRHEKASDVRQCVVA